MKELGPVTRQMIERARVGLGPDDVAVARMRARVAGIVAAGVVASAADAAAAVGSGTGGAVGAGVAGGKLVALVVAAMVATGAIGTATVVAIARMRDDRAVPSAPRPAPRAPHVSDAPPPGVMAPSPPAAQAPTTATPHELRAVDERSAPVAHPRREPARTAAAAAPQVASLARELSLIDDASSALHAGHPADALAAIASYERETAGAGQLAQDAAAIELEARCELHDPTAPDKLAAFTRRWPHSAERARIAVACGAGVPARSR